MNRVKSEAEIQDEYRAKVALMPPGLVARYVPLIKAYERMVLRFHTELASLAPFDDAEVEALHADEWNAEMQQYVEDTLDVRYPGVRQRFLEISEDYGRQLEDLAKPFSVENFVADGGTAEQLENLHQAVLCGVFSRPRLPQGPAPA